MSSFICVLEGTARDVLMRIRTLAATEKCSESMFGPRNVRTSSTLETYLPSITTSSIWLVSPIRRQPSGFVDVAMLTSGATDYHVSRRSEIDQPQAVRRSCRVEAELSDSGTKDSFLPNLRIEIPEDNLDVMARAFVV